MTDVLPKHEETYLPSKAKWVWMLAIAVGMTTLSFWGIFVVVTLVGRVVVGAWMAFFAIGVIVAFLQLLPSCSFLRLSPEGFIVRVMWREKFYRWSDIEQFGVAEIGAGEGPPLRLVVVRFSNAYIARGGKNRMGAINRTLDGFDDGLPNTYGWDCAELAAYLNIWREEFGGRVPH